MKLGASKFIIKPQEPQILLNLINDVLNNKDQNQILKPVQMENDKEIYKKAQTKVGDISPWNSIFKYQLPALIKQKNEMARQTVELIGEDSTYDGYLEIGSTGRYLDYLEEKVKIKGERYYADGKEPGYAITEMIDRGQIGVGAKYIPMADYNTKYSAIIPNQSLDLITVYIGFHHCPIKLRTIFISLYSYIHNLRFFNVFTTVSFTDNITLNFKNLWQVNTIRTMYFVLREFLKTQLSSNSNLMKNKN